MEQHSDTIDTLDSMQYRRMATDTTVTSTDSVRLHLNENSNSLSSGASVSLLPSARRELSCSAYSPFVPDAVHKISGLLVPGEGFLPNPDDLPPPVNGIVRIETVGDDASCGCPGCNDTQIRFKWAKELRDLYEKDSPEWEALNEDFSEAMRRTSVSECPHNCIALCTLGLYLLCWIPAHKHYAQKRHDLTCEIFTRENERIRSQGLRWSISSTFDVHPHRVTAVLHWISGIREDYEAANPQRRKVSQEPYPRQLLTDAQQRARELDPEGFEAVRAGFQLMAPRLERMEEKQSPFAARGSGGGSGSSVPLRSRTPGSYLEVSIPLSKKEKEAKKR